MTRLTEALKRAGATQKQSPDDVPTGLTADHSPRVDAPPTFDFSFTETGAVAEGSKRSMWPPAVSETEVTKDEPAATAVGTLTRCPGCERVEGVRTHVLGFWERRVLSLMRIRPYRCDFCGYRFYRFNRESAGPVTDQKGGKVFSTFLRPADNRDFNELIRDIAQAEWEQQRSQDSNSYPVHGKWHKRELRESLNWPAVSSGQKTDPRM